MLIYLLREVFISLGYLFLGRGRQGDQGNQIHDQRGWNLSNKKLRACRLEDLGVWVMVIFLCICNIGLVIFPCIPSHKDAYGRDGGPIVKGYTYPIVTAGLLGIAAIYYLLCFANLGGGDWSLLSLVGLKSDIRPLCTRQRHPYFGYEYRVFISTEFEGRRQAASLPDQTMGHPSVSPNMTRAQGSSSPTPTAGGSDIDPAVRIEVRDRPSRIDLMLKQVYCPNISN